MTDSDPPFFPFFFFLLLILLEGCGLAIELLAPLVTARSLTRTARTCPALFLFYNMRPVSPIRPLPPSLAYIPNIQKLPSGEKHNENIKKKTGGKERERERKKKSINLSVTTRRQRNAEVVRFFGTRNSRRSTTANNQACVYIRPASHMLTEPSPKNHDTSCCSRCRRPAPLYTWALPIIFSSLHTARRM